MEIWDILNLEFGQFGILANVYLGNLEFLEFEILEICSYNTSVAVAIPVLQLQNLFSTYNTIFAIAILVLQLKY